MATYIGLRLRVDPWNMTMGHEEFSSMGEILDVRIKFQIDN